MANLLKYSLIFFGLTVVLIGGGIVIFGPHIVGNYFAELVAVFSDTYPTVAGLGDPNTDSELRFYSVVFIALGGLIFWIGKGLEDRMKFVPVPAIIFFVGGSARLLSMSQVGWPHPVFVGLMVIEFVVPILVLILWLAVKRESS